jgi:hypothetical protein
MATWNNYTSILASHSMRCESACNTGTNRYTYESLFIRWHVDPLLGKNSVTWVRRRELYRPSDRRLSAKLVPTLADRGCRVVSATKPPQLLISVFLDRSRYFLEIAPKLSSQGWVLLLGNDSVNTFPQQRIRMQQSDNFRCCETLCK